MDTEIAKEFIEQIVYRMDESTRMIKLSFERLTEDDIWRKSNESSNSIGNLILHLCGNITQYAIASLGNTEDKRNRDKEFSSEEQFSKEKLVLKLTNTVEQAKKTLNTIGVSELLKKREVQGYHFSGLGIAIHVAEHYSYHTGQIAFLTKQLKNKKSLGFYDGVDLNIKNKSKSC